jgi:hypothetical protein
MLEGQPIHTHILSKIYTKATVIHTRLATGFIAAKTIPLYLFFIFIFYLLDHIKRTIYYLWNNFHSGTNYCRTKITLTESGLYIWSMI